MAPFNPLNEKLYDELATNVTYAKLFPLILEDFLHRKDCQIMVQSMTAQVGPATGKVIAPYDGSMATVGKLDLPVKKAIVMSGGVVDKVLA